jgi:deoxyhypusine monooxygenase
VVRVLKRDLTTHRVRHEAGEALGAIGTQECFDLLQQYEQDACLEVAQTCQLALQRIQHYASVARAAEETSDESGNVGPPRASVESIGNDHSIWNRPASERAGQGASMDGASPYLSVDPAPAAPASAPSAQLRSVLLDEDAPIFERYRALFALRNRGGGLEVRTQPRVPTQATLASPEPPLMHAVRHAC